MNSAVGTETLVLCHERVIITSFLDGFVLGFSNQPYVGKHTCMCFVAKDIKTSQSIVK